jgi:hypothetical protein
MREIRFEYWFLVGSLEGMHPLERRRRSWEYNIKIVLQEVGLGMEWTELAHDTDTWRTAVNGVMNIRVT